MGYYNERPGTEKKEKLGGWLVPILIGIGVGILLIIVVYPSLANKKEPKNIINDSSIQSNEPIGGNYIAVDVSNQITEVVEKGSQTVVGVTNIQNQTGFWQQ